MRSFSSFALLAVVTGADIWSRNGYLHCYEGHGGTPVGAKDVELANTTTSLCKKACENDPNCHAFTISKSSRRRRPTPQSCYLRSSVDLQACQQSYTWDTYTQVAPPSLTGIIAYHLFESKYTGLANKDAGDFKGDAGFIFGTFSKYQKDNPEASMEHNIIEMSEVNVTGWGQYEECNAPGASEFTFNCSADASDYCCTTHDPNNRSHNIPAVHTKDQLPGLEVSVMSLGSQFGFPGFWFSFPKESEGVTWTQKTLRRIAGKCVGNAWRTAAGGCSECGEVLDQCVAGCIQQALCVNGSTDKLEQIWNRVFADPNECPDVALPSADAASSLVV